MKALIYSALIAAILGAGLAWEKAHAPAPIVTEAPQETNATLSIDQVETPASATEVGIKIVEEKTPASAPAPTAAEEPEVAVAAEGAYTEAFVRELELAVHNRINQERVGQGLKTLEYDTLLADVAALHSTDMAQQNYFAHEDKKGCDSSCRVTAAEYKWRMVGENLFFLKREPHFSVDGASAVVVAGWMGSPGHRKNLFEDDFTHEGIGVVIKGDAIYVTEVLTRPR